MADARDYKNATLVYETLKKVFDDREWKYTAHDDDLVVTYGVRGDDIPMDFVFKTDAERQLVALISMIPCVIPEDKRDAFALIVCAVNNKLADGNFDFDYESGHVYFRITSSFRESLISDAFIDYITTAASTIVDVYNDKFLMIATGMLSPEEFLAGE